MGATEEAGKVASGIVAGLQPLPLALVVINLAFIGFNIWFLNDLIDATTDTNKRRDGLMMQLIKDCTIPQVKKEE